ncbi:MAG: ImmA/IrrE family metallo-endopeptidase [Desulfobacterales bacterium]|jgi:Zn-dependent peptidase ImmA (M78 family)
MNTPWLPKKRIHKKAEGVITDYESKTGNQVAPPIPIEDIIESGLNLKRGCIEFEDDTMGGDILGATFVRERMVCVNAKLLQSRHEGRLNFTWAHEAGHWVLHRQFIVLEKRSDSAGGKILCRTRDIKKPMEWQADYFAACLLMPDAFVHRAFQEVFGRWPLQVCNVTSKMNGPLYFDPCVKNWHCIADSVREAGGFSNVSKQAMIIRLQDLGWVVNETNIPMDWKCIPLPN